MSRTTFEVTQADIDRGIKNHSSRCMVTQTIIRSIPEAKRVETDMQTIRWTQNGERIVYITPYAVQDYLIAFDAGDEIKPFKFALDHDRRMTSPVMKRNAAAKKVGKVDSKVRNGKRRVQALEQKVVEVKAEGKPAVEVKAVQAQVKAAKAKVAEAEKEQEEVKKVEGPKAKYTRDRTNTTRKQPVKRVGTTSKRSNTRYYGRRLMRVNQDGHAARVEEASERIRTHRAPRKAAPATKAAAKKPAAK